MVLNPRFILPLVLLTISPCTSALSIAVPDNSVATTLPFQIALERAGFSPGMVDGKTGPKTAIAICEYQKAHNLRVTGFPDGATLASLNVDTKNYTTKYTITESDQKLITGVTTDWNLRSQMELLGYESLADLVAEKFHTSQRCLAALNSTTNLANLSAGDSLWVPNIDPNPASARATHLEVNLSQKVIRAFDANDRTVAIFHCSIAADKAKRPSGQAHVVAVAINPNYTFDPAMWPDVHNVKTKLTIPPGPRNPVGVAWVSLSLPGYGMHGTPHPEQIGKTGSHGCFRLANWDAIRLSKLVKVGMPVSFITDTQTASADR